MAPRGSRKEHSILTSTLQRVDRRVRINGALDQLSIAVCLVLGLLLTFQIGRMVLPVTPPPGFWVVGGSSLLFGAFLAWSERGGSRLARAAAVADTRADLHDELKTAYWFMGLGGDSAWIDLQLHRAAETARGLDPRGLVPTTVPRRFVTALGLFVALQVLAFIPMEGPLLTFASASDSTAIAASQAQQLEEIRDLVEATETDDDAEVLAQLEETLRELEADQLSMEELLRDLREAQNMLEEGNLEMNALEEALADLAQGFEDSEELGDFAEALEDENLDLASELMRELSENLSNLTDEETAELMAQLQEAAMSDLPGLEDLLESLQEAADALANQETQDAQEALEEAADRLEEMSDRQEAQEGRNEASEQMESMGEQTTEQQSGMEQLLGMQQGEGGDEAAESGMAMPSDEVKQSAGSTEAQDPSGPPGHATSESMGGEQEFGAATTLEVQLSMEVLDEPEPRPESEPDPDDVFKGASREESSTLQYRDVRSFSSYAEGSALAVDQIPWRYRSLVKKYFLAIRPRGNQ
jgi:hypothetical protein